MTVAEREPPDDWGPQQWRDVSQRMGEEIPAEPVHELSQAHLDFICWLVVTGRLEGDTPPLQRRGPFDYILEGLA